MQVQRVRNPELIKTLLEDDALRQSSSEDGTNFQAFEPDVDGMVWLALIDDDQNVRGFLMGEQRGRATVELHVAIRSEFWGDHKTNVKLGRLAIAQLVSMGARKLTAEVPVDSRQVVRYAQRCGLQREGINKRSFLRNGEMIDQYYLGLVVDD